MPRDLKYRDDLEKSVLRAAEKIDSAGEHASSLDTISPRAAAVTAISMTHVPSCFHCRELPLSMRDSIKNRPSAADSALITPRQVKSEVPCPMCSTKIGADSSRTPGDKR